MLPLGDDRHKLSTYLSGFACTPQIIQSNRCAAGNTVCALPIHCAILRFALAGGHDITNGRRYRTVIHVGINPGFFAFLFREPPFTGQRHLRSASRVGASYSTHPEPGNHGGFATTVFFRERYLGIEVPNTPFGLVAHPLSIVANIFSQPVRAMPVASHQRSLCFWIDRWTTCKLWRYFNQCLGYQHGNGIQIASMRLHAKPWRFQGNRTAATEGIE